MMPAERKKEVLRPDSKGRITIGVRPGVSGYRQSIDSDGKITLDPLIERPAREQWLYDNPEALAKVLKGLDDAAAGKVKSLGSFAQYADSEDK
jgi:hypothetical protein